MEDLRIGLKDETGAIVKYPELDAFGQNVEWPVSGTLNLDARHFVVLAVGRSVDDDLLTELRAALPKPSSILRERPHVTND